MTDEMTDELLLHRNMDCLNGMYGKCIFKMKQKNFCNFIVYMSYFLYGMMMTYKTVNRKHYYIVITGPQIGRT